MRVAHIQIMNSTIKLSAFLPDHHSRALLMLQGLLDASGGWILSQVAVDPLTEQIVLEFPLDVSIEIYGAMVSLGLDFSPSSHLRFTQLCRAASYFCDVPPRTLLAFDEASLDESTRYVCSLAIIKVQLDIRRIDRLAPGSGEAYAA
jgi:hypothetical protein